MPVYKEKSGTWRVNYRFTDWTGANKQTTKRGFATRREAVTWEKEQSIKLKASLNMTFGSFVDLYTADMKCRVRENTWQSKDHIIRTKILPYFKDRKIGDINSRDVVTWQNELLSLTMDNGEHYSQNYLKTVHNQLSAIFNHAVKYYDLPKNPAALVGNMARKRKRKCSSGRRRNTVSLQMPLWTNQCRFTPLRCCIGPESGKGSFWPLHRPILTLQGVL